MYIMRMKYSKNEIFPNSVKGQRENPPPVAGIRNFAGVAFLLCGGNLRRSDFDHLNLSQS